MTEEHTPTPLPGANPVPIKLNETSRTYFFSNNDTIVVDNVRELFVSASGNHRLKTEDGTLVIIASGWLAISIIDSKKEWTV